MNPEIRTRRSWWLPVTQWLAIAALSVSALVDAMQDHGVLMAINCFCLGIVVFSMLETNLLAHVMRNAREAEDGFRAAEAVMRAACEQLQRDVQSGKVEVVPLQPFRDGDHDGPTRH